MTTEKIEELLRARILRGLHAGTLKVGQLLPSAREAGADFQADHRRVLAAYRRLADEGLVEIRQRSGMYVARQGPAVTPVPGVDWLVELLLQGLGRDIRLPDLPDWIHRAIATRPLRALVIEGTRDQVAGIARELHDDYGFEAMGLDVADLTLPEATLDARVRGIDLLVSTTQHAQPVRQLGRRVGIPVIIADVGPDLLGGEWRTLLREPLYLLVGDERSVTLLEKRFERVAGAAENLRFMVVGRDNLASIPDDAAVYVTHGAAAALGTTPVGGRILPSARGFSPSAARELIAFVVSENVKVLSSSAGAPPRAPGGH